MQVGLFLVLAAAALWRAGADWQATIGQGYAYRLGTIGSLLSARWPEGYARLAQGVHASGIPFAWDPVGAFLMSMPAALVLGALAFGVWVTRGRGRAR